MLLTELAGPMATVVGAEPMPVHRGRRAAGPVVVAVARPRPEGTVDLVVVAERDLS